jgi:hypothetical protein
MSDVDLQKGADWNQTLTSELEATSFGLFCLTPENLSSPWLLFEAGAIARRPGLKRVFTHLFDLADNDVPWPLAQFQSTKSTRDDLFKMVVDINRLFPDPLDKGILQTAFDRGWPDFESAFAAIPSTAEEERPKSKTDLMLEEIVMHIRQQVREPQRVEIPVGKEISVGLDSVFTNEEMKAFAKTLLMRLIPVALEKSFENIAVQTADSSPRELPGSSPVDTTTKLPT